MIKSSFSMIINDFRVDDDQRVPCQWLSMISVSLMFNEFLVDDE